MHTPRRARHKLSVFFPLKKYCVKKLKVTIIHFMNDFGDPAAQHPLLTRTRKCSATLKKFGTSLDKLSKKKNSFATTLEDERLARWKALIDFFRFRSETKLNFIHTTHVPSSADLDNKVSACLLQECGQSWHL